MILDTSALVAILHREPEAHAFVGRIHDGDVCRVGVANSGELARQTFLDFGKDRHKAGLNFGDCFSYALAKATGEALLFKGADFALTDIRPA